MVISKKIRSFFYQGIIGLALLFVISTALDWLRAPTYPDNFSQQSFVTVNGDTVTLAELSQDKPLLVYIWATWCNICRLTTPAVGKISAEDNNVMSIALRSGDDNKVKTYLAQKNIQMPIINDSRGELAKTWDISATPTFILMNKGKVSYSMTGWTSAWSLKLRLALIKLFA